MINIIIEDKQSLLEVNFIELGCVYHCKKDSLNSLCKNIIRLYYESSIKNYNELKFEYIPINKCDYLFKKNRKHLKKDYIVFNNKKILYNIEKI